METLHGQELLRHSFEFLVHICMTRIEISTSSWRAWHLLPFILLLHYLQYEINILFFCGCGEVEHNWHSGEFFYSYKSSMRAMIYHLEQLCSQVVICYQNKLTRATGRGKLSYWHPANMTHLPLISMHISNHNSLCI